MCLSNRAPSSCQPSWPQKISTEGSTKLGAQRPPVSALLRKLLHAGCVEFGSDGRPRAGSAASGRRAGRLRDRFADRRAFSSRSTARAPLQRSFLASCPALGRDHELVAGVVVAGKLPPGLSSPECAAPRAIPALLHSFIRRRPLLRARRQRARPNVCSNSSELAGVLPMKGRRQPASPTYDDFH